MTSNRSQAITLFLALFLVPWDLCTGTVTMDLVAVGDTDNIPDTLTGLGSVSYVYQIGRYETAVSQYAEFLNATATADPYSLYNPKMAAHGIVRDGAAGSYRYQVIAGLDNRPVAYVSWYDAARFCNWLANGQGTGGTEDGSYTLNGATSGRFAVNSGATIYLPSENEWYKAAYYNPTSFSYSAFANGKNEIGADESNFNSSGSVAVDSFLGSESAYGTLGQSGNILEWTGSEVFGASLVLRGGSWCCVSLLGSASYRSAAEPEAEIFHLGFRVAQVRASAIPEPRSLGLCLLAAAGLLCRRKRFGGSRGRTP